MATDKEVVLCKIKVDQEIMMERHTVARQEYHYVASAVQYLGKYVGGENN